MINRSPRSPFLFLAASAVLTASAALSAATAQNILAQVEKESAPRQDTVVLLPFPPTGITEAFVESGNLITESGKHLLTGEQVTVFTGEVDSIFSTIDGFLQDTAVVSLEGISAREMDQISLRASSYRNRLDEEQARLARSARELEDVSQSLADNKQRWVLTLKGTPEEEMMESRVEHIRKTTRELDSARALIQEDLGILLGLQDRISDRKTRLEEVEQHVREKKDLLGRSLFTRDMPGLFRELSGFRDTTLLGTHREVFMNSLRTDYRMLRPEYTRSLVISGVFFILLLGLALWYSRNYGNLTLPEDLEFTETHLKILREPVVSVLFIMTLMIRFLLSDLPQTFLSLDLMILMVSLAILVIRLFGTRIRAWIILLVTVNVLTLLYELSYHPGILLRLLLLVLSLTGLGLYAWILVRKPLLGSIRSNFVYRLFRLLIVVFSVMLFIAIIANVAGAFRLAEFFTLLPIQITVLAIGILVSSRLAGTIVFMLLASKQLQKVNVVREEFQVIYKKTVRLIELFLWIFFFSAALRIFRVRDAVFEWGRDLLNNGRKIGAVDITLKNILIFVFVLWLSIVITRIVRHVLEKDVFTRVKTAKGIPSTVILLVRIALITGGFFLAAAAAGMELTNLSIVLGAFSVGIGFGLQNIFNNMVSGLILAFERPIKVGDVVQVGELMGVVRSIGLRSSTVHSFEGAEVIVPNGNLISSEMINWTLSDSNRRMDIRIGVAYGTDPGVVMGIMKEIAVSHEKVRKNPAPAVFFNAFGDSALEFRLLAWTHVDNRLEVESEINVALDRRLKEAGIEIPFPQRDLHIRSDDTKPEPGKSRV
jgi:potassium efflux system protein